MNKIDIKRNRKTPSDQSILGKKNFDSVLESYKSTMSPKKWFQSMKLWSGVVATACLAGVIGMYLSSNNSEESSSSKELSAQEMTEKFNKELELSYLSNQEVFSFDSNRDTLIITANGSVINIPGHSFSAENHVKLVINEINDPIKMFQSKIDMGYDSSGTAYHFESAGMIEMQAFDGSKEINLNPGKEINVALVTTTTDPTYNLYIKTPNNWDYITTANDIFDPLSIEEINSSIAKDTECNDQSKVTNSNTKIGKADPKFATFEINVSRHAELKDYKGIMFQVDPSETNFIQDYYMVSWEKIDLRKKDKEYHIILERGGKMFDFKVNPVLNSTEYAEYLKNNRSKSTQFSSTKSLKDKWEQSFEKQNLSFNYSQENKSYKVYSALNSDLSYLVTSKPRRVFNVQSMGVLNCDHVLPKDFTDKAKLKTLAFKYDGHRFDPEVAYVVIPGINTLFTFNGAGLKYYAKHGETKVWIVQDGKIGILQEINKQQYEAINFFDTKSGIKEIEEYVKS